ncbi:MAG: Lrp/AsnC family transcriptional regulator [Bauldia sp.]|nr:Lrp/AsnC family transcriptional regulator [Bauldia sp.]
MSKLTIDRIDRRILDTLQADGRLSNVDLAERIGLSPSPCLRRVKHLEDAGMIVGYRAVLDRKAIGLGLTVFIELKVGKHSRDNAAMLQEALLAIPEVVSCHMVSGVSDFLAEVVVPDLDAYERLMTEKILTLPTIEDVRSNFAIRTVKSDAPLPLGHMG